MKKHLWNMLVGVVLVTTSAFTFQGITPHLLAINNIPTEDELRLMVYRDSVDFVKSKLSLSQLECIHEVTRLQVENTVLDTINQSMLSDFEELYAIAEKAIEDEKTIMNLPRLETVRYLPLKINKDSIYQEVLREKAQKYRDSIGFKMRIKDANGKIIK